MLSDKQTLVQKATRLQKWSTFTLGSAINGRPMTGATTLRLWTSFLSASLSQSCLFLKIRLKQNQELGYKATTSGSHSKNNTREPKMATSSWTWLTAWLKRTLLRELPVKLLFIHTISSGATSKRNGRRTMWTPKKTSQNSRSKRKTKPKKATWNWS